MSLTLPINYSLWSNWNENNTLNLEFVISSAVNLFSKLNEVLARKIDSVYIISYISHFMYYYSFIRALNTGTLLIRISIKTFLTPPKHILWFILGLHILTDTHGWLQRYNVQQYTNWKWWANVLLIASKN